ncbi:PAS domain-containing protein [Planctomycetota bacterium]
MEKRSRAVARLQRPVWILAFVGIGTGALMLGTVARSLAKIQSHRVAAQEFREKATATIRSANQMLNASIEYSTSLLAGNDSCDRPKITIGEHWDSDRAEGAGRNLVSSLGELDRFNGSCLSLFRSIKEAELQRNEARKLADHALRDYRIAFERIDGKRLLDFAGKIHHYRSLNEEERVKYAVEILDSPLRSGTQRNCATGLSEVAVLIEQLCVGEQIDNLVDIKDNRLQPCFSRLRRPGDVTEYENSKINEEKLSVLESSVFGQGFEIDRAHQMVVVGSRGLYATCANLLSLRAKSEQLDSRLRSLVHAFGVARMDLHEQVQRSEQQAADIAAELISSAWKTMAAVGGSLSIIFLIFARKVTSTLNRQFVSIREQAIVLEQTAGALQDSNDHLEMLSAIAKYTDNAVTIANKNGEVEWINEGFTRITGYTSEEIVGKSRFDVQLVPNAECGEVNSITASMAQAERYDGELMLQRKNGESYWASVELRPLFNAAGELTQFISIESDISCRKTAEAEKEKLQEQLVHNSRQIGMAEIATGVLHNVGNVLNSVNVSAGVIKERLSDSKEEKLVAAAELIAAKGEDLGEFVMHDARGRHFPAYLLESARAMQQKNSNIGEELGNLVKNVEHIKDIVAMQQSYAKQGGLSQRFLPHDAMEDALKIVIAGLNRHGIELRQEYCPKFYVDTDKHKVIQILVNLISNAKQAVSSHECEEKLITLSICQNEQLVFEVEDTGIGFTKETGDRLFEHGFTTKKDGHGFGLHSSAIAAKEIGGRLCAHSDGPGCGARFSLYLPHPVEAEQDANEEDSKAALTGQLVDAT